MNSKLSNIPEYFTYDDVLLLPALSTFSRGDIDITTKLTPTITLASPFVSAPMDTVTEHKLAIALAESGGIGILHRNLSVENQVAEAKKVKDKQLPVGAAIGASPGFEDRAEHLIEAGCDIILIDSAHGHAASILQAIAYIKKTYKVSIMAGNVATYDGARALIDAGADSLRVGMGPGAICTTRIVSGMGVPQLTAVSECVRAAENTDVSIVADGGIKYSGDMVKALAVGAHAVMMGRMFASCAESPGEIIEHEGKKLKGYRGMGSIGAMEKGAEIKSEDEFHGKSYKDRVLVAEGVEGLVEITGTVQEMTDQWIGGIKSGMYYVGCRSLEELRKNAQFIKITQASLTESHPHNLLITNPGKSYH